MRRNFKKKKPNFSYNLAIIMGIMILVCFLAGCAEPQPIIKTVNVEVPCEVENVPQAPRDIDLNEATIKEKMQYIKEAMQYAKEVKPIMRDCVREKRIKAKR